MDPMTLDSARGSDGCEASPRLPTGLCGSRIRTDDSLYIPCSGVLLLDDRLAADGHGGAGAGRQQFDGSSELGVGGGV